MKRALIVKLGALGDVVMALPAVHELAARGYSIDWIAGGPAAAILRLYPSIRIIEADEAAILGSSFPSRMRALRAVWSQVGLGRYDLVATLYYDRRYRLLTLPARAERRIRLRHDRRAFQLLPGRHHSDELRRILLHAIGVEAADEGPRPESIVPLHPEHLPPSPLPPAQGVRVVLAAGGARNALRDDALRRWPLENYAALAGLLLQAGYEVVLTGGRDDGWVRQGFASLPCTDLIGKLTVPELLALFDATDAVVTHDSGPLHLAGITKCSLLGIFGPVDPATRLPRRKGTAALWGGEGFACRPCYDGSTYAVCGHNACIEQVTPGMASARLRALLIERQQTGSLNGASRAPASALQVIA